jgi:hypothetical protein
VRFAVEAQLRNGGNSSTGNAFQGQIGFDYMGLSMDFLGGKIEDAVSSGILSAAQLSALNAMGVAPGNGLLSVTVSDNTVFSVDAKYTIGPCYSAAMSTSTSPTRTTHSIPARS